MAVIAEWTDWSLEVTPQICLLGMAKRTKRTQRYLKFADLAMVLFKRQIARSWKASHLPPLREWLRELLKWTIAEAATLTHSTAREFDYSAVSTWDRYVMRVTERVHPAPVVANTVAGT